MFKGKTDGKLKKRRRQDNDTETTNFMENPELRSIQKILSIFMCDGENRKEETMRFNLRIIQTANTHMQCKSAPNRDKIEP